MYNEACKVGVGRRVVGGVMHTKSEDSKTCRVSHMWLLLNYGETIKPFYREKTHIVF